MSNQNTSTFFSFDNFRNELLAIGLAAYFSAFLNAPLWDALLQTQSGVLPSQRWLFMWTGILGITAFQILFISLLCWGRFAKLSAAVLVLVTSTTHYFSAHYRVYFDKSMIRNVLATNVGEASELITFKMILSVGLYAIPILIFLYFFRPTRTPLRRQLAAKAITVAVASIVVMGSIFFQFKNLSSAMRNHREVRHLILPASPAFALVRALGADAADAAVVRAPLDSMASRESGVSGKALLTVVVVGETVRAQNWGLSGYARQTTPRLASLPSSELYNLPYLRSCGTNTEVSVPCMFSGIGRRDYDETFIKSHFSVLQLMGQTGIQANWIDNQSGCKGVCDGISSVYLKDLFKESEKSEFVLDEKFIPAMRQTVSKEPGDQVIVLHMLGNHGPAYYRRYPTLFRKFTTVC